MENVALRFKLYIVVLESKDAYNNFGKFDYSRTVSLYDKNFAPTLLLINHCAVVYILNVCAYSISNSTLILQRCQKDLIIDGSSFSRNWTKYLLFKMAYKYANSKS